MGQPVGGPERGASDDEAPLDAELTDLHASTVEKLLEDMNAAPSDLDLIGFHGQTIWHRPDMRATWQMGDGSRLARALKTPVAFDFRSADVNAGGQGAPLLPIYHAALARQHGLPAAILNIGGVANITCIGSEPGQMLGFDTGPGNGMIDDWVKARLGVPMDTGGQIAAKGRVHRDLVERMMEHPYFEKEPPKSLDRFDFSAVPVAHLSLEDGAATLTAFTAASIARALKHCLMNPCSLLVTGGGRHNATLMAMLAEYTGVDVRSVDDVGWRGDVIEAQGFAYMAARCLRGLPITFPGTTGIVAPMTGGCIVQP